MSLWKRAWYQAESKSFEKLIVEEIVRDSGLDLLNPFDMDLARNRI